MSEPDVDVNLQSPNEIGETEKKKPIASWRWVLLGVLGLILIAAASAFGGYYSANQQILNQEETLIANELSLQYELAIKDFESKNYSLARQRLEYILRTDPEFPGATDLLTETLLSMMITATFTPAPTLTVTPTQDLRNENELYNSIQQFLGASDWTSALNTLDTLRKNNPEYQAVDIDGFYFLAYRNRGIERILNGELEAGIYDLDQAEILGPLDVEAYNIRAWGSWYITGANFWDVDWAQAEYYFGLIAPVAPNLHAGSGFTASERHRIAALEYGEQLADAEQWCDAAAMLELSLSYGPNEEIEELVNLALQKCEEELGRITPEP